MVADDEKRKKRVDAVLYYAVYVVAGVGNSSGFRRDIGAEKELRSKRVRRSGEACTWCIEGHH